MRPDLCTAQELDNPVIIETQGSGNIDDDLPLPVGAFCFTLTVAAQCRRSIVWRIICRDRRAILSPANNMRQEVICVMGREMHGLPSLDL